MPVYHLKKTAARSQIQTWKKLSFTEFRFDIRLKQIERIFQFSSKVNLPDTTPVSFRSVSNSTHFRLGTRGPRQPLWPAKFHLVFFDNSKSTPGLGCLCSGQSTIFYRCICEFSIQEGGGASERALKLEIWGLRRSLLSFFRSKFFKIPISWLNVKT